MIAQKGLGGEGGGGVGELCLRHSQNGYIKLRTANMGHVFSSSNPLASLLSDLLMEKIDDRPSIFCACSNPAQVGGKASATIINPKLMNNLISSLMGFKSSSNP